MRKLGKTEYFYWLYDQIECTNFLISASLHKFDSSVSIEKPLKQTISNIQRLQERLVLTKKKEISFELSHEYRTTISYYYGNHERLNKLMIKELSTRFNNDQLPIRVILFLQIPDNKFILTVTFNHVFTDGIGALRIFRELVGNIYTPGLQDHNNNFAKTPSQESLFPKSVRGIRLPAKALRFIIKRRKENKINRIDTDSRFKCPEKRGLQLERIHLSEPQSQQLLDLCRKKKITLTSFIAAVQCSLIRDLLDLSGNVLIPIQIPFDNRSRLLGQKELHTPGLFISIPEIRPILGKEYNICDLAETIGAEIKRISNSWERYMTFQLFPSKLFSPDNRGVEMLEKSMLNKALATTLTNLGVINKYWEFDSTLIDSLDIAVAPARNCIMCTSIITYNKSICLNLAYNTAILGEGPIKDITERYFSRLTILPYDIN